MSEIFKIALVSITITLSLLLGSSSSFAQNLTFEDVKHFIKTNEVKSIDDLLPLLPEEYRSRSTYVYSSRSIQDASPESPRVVMFGRDASLMMSFNGHPSQKGHENLEIIKFNKDTKEYELFEIQFDPDKKSGPTISDKNPSKCLTCHGDKPKPIWDTYFMWPGVVGAEDDDQTQLEKRYMKDFIEKKSTHSRYKYVPEQKLIFAAGIDGFVENMGPNGNGIQINSELNALLNRQNFQIIAQDLKNDPVAYDLRYAILGAMTCPSEEIDSFIPESIRKKMKSSKAIYKTNLENSLKEYFEKRKKKQIQISGKNLESDRFSESLRGEEVDESWINLQWILGNFNYSTKDWPLTFEKGTQAFNDGRGGIKRLEFYLWKELLDKDRDKTEYQIFSKEFDKINNNLMGSEYSFYFAQDDKKSLCESLKKKSLETLGKDMKKHKQNVKFAPVCEIKTVLISPSGEQLSEEVFKIAKKTNPMNSCFQCHADFKSEEGLKEYFKAKYPKGNFLQEVQYRLKSQGKDRMPKNKVISKEEQDAILEYLANFSKKVK